MMCVVWQAKRESLLDALRERARQHEQHVVSVRQKKLELSASGAALDTSSTSTSGTGDTGDATTAGDAAASDAAMAVGGAAAAAGVTTDVSPFVCRSPPVIHSPFKAFSSR